MAPTCPQPPAHTHPFPHTCPQSQPQPHRSRGSSRSRSHSHSHSCRRIRSCSQSHSHRYTHTQPQTQSHVATHLCERACCLSGCPDVRLFGSGRHSAVERHLRGGGQTGVKGVHAVGYSTCLGRSVPSMQCSASTQGAATPAQHSASALSPQQSASAPSNQSSEPTNSPLVLAAARGRAMCRQSPGYWRLGR